jgi:hypothetical protein
MPFREPDLLGVFLKRGDNVTVGAVTTKGVVELNVSEILPGPSGGFSAQDIAVLVKAGVLALASKVAFTIEDGDHAGDYTVRQFDPEPPDGAMTRVRLLRA